MTMNIAFTLWMGWNEIVLYKFTYHILWKKKYTFTIYRKPVILTLLAILLLLAYLKYHFPLYCHYHHTSCF